MNRFAYANIDPTLTPMRRELALRTSHVKRRRKDGRKPTGYDTYAGKRLEARVKDFEHTVSDAKKAPAFTRPGSMQRP